ncbi:MAG TPA: hypothetical protein VH643_39325 [Gemmataceae bacterium]
MSTIDVFQRGACPSESKRMSQLRKPRIGHRSFWPLLALSSCLIAGCVDRSTEGKISVYTFFLWILIVAVLSGLALVAIGFFTRKKAPRWRAYVVMVFGVLVIVIVVPMMRLDRVEVDDEHFVSTHGLPWNRVRHDVRFDQLREIRVETTVTKSRTGGTRKNYALLCQSKSGATEKVPVGNLLEHAVGQIFVIARQKGVQVVGTEEMPESMLMQ